MGANLFLQILVGLCFLGLVIVLFFEKEDYVTYSILIILIAGVASAIIMPETVTGLRFFVDLIEWNVIFFLIGIFTIIEILNDKKIFFEVSRRIVKKYGNNVRKMFYMICIISTLTATVLEDLSVAIIFGPIIIISCKKLKINPTPFLLGMTVCINLASTLTPFGSAQNIVIVTRFDLSALWFIKYFGLFFVTATTLTLILLDRFMLKRYIDKIWEPRCGENTPPISEPQKVTHIFYSDRHELYKEDYRVDNKTYYKNLAALLLFIILLIIIPTLYLPCIISALIFVFINPIKGADGKYRPSISYYLGKVDYKLIYFFICLFILVGLMEVNGSLDFLEHLVETISPYGIFTLSLIIMISSSLLSGFMDNAPVTVAFLPIIEKLLAVPSLSNATVPIIFAFVLGINLGGNFLPQGSACDMMTLEIARQNCVEELTYKKLFKVGGLFALLHIIIGIAYLALLIYIPY